MAEKRTNRALITSYNEWVKEQESSFERSKTHCPYFTIDKDTLDKLSPEHAARLEEVKAATSRELGLKMWGILSENIRTYKPTKNEKEAKEIQKRIVYTPTPLKERVERRSSVIAVERLHTVDILKGLHRNRGFLIPEKHLHWYEENGFITPLVKHKGVNYYATYQLHSLVQIESWKEKTLEYPKQNSSAILTTWQELLDLNKETIVQGSKRWDEVATLLLDISDLHGCFFEDVARTIWKSHGNGPIRSKLMNDFMSHYAAITGKHYADLIKKQNPSVTEERIPHWIGTLLHQAFLLNPLLEKAHESLAILKISQEDSIRMKKLGVKHGVANAVRLSNWYLELVQYLAFYYECLTGEKITSPAIVPMLSMHSTPLKTSRCEICGSEYTPTPRRGGRPQKICGNDECKKERDKRSSRESRKKQKRSDR